MHVEFEYVSHGTERILKESSIFNRPNRSRQHYTNSRPYSTSTLYEFHYRTKEPSFLKLKSFSDLQQHQIETFGSTLYT